MNWLAKLHTEVDNVTPDWSKVMASVVACSGLLLQGFDVVVHHVHFDMKNFGIGAGALAAGVSALFKLKKESNVPFNPPGPDVQVNAVEK